jgi:hypothetical protein
MTTQMKHVKLYSCEQKKKKPDDGVNSRDEKGSGVVISELHILWYMFRKYKLFITVIVFIKQNNIVTAWNVLIW